MSAKCLQDYGGSKIGTSERAKVWQEHDFSRPRCTGLWREHDKVFGAGSMNLTQDMSGTVAMWEDDACPKI